MKCARGLRPIAGNPPDAASGEGPDHIVATAGGMRGPRPQPFLPMLTKRRLLFSRSVRLGTVCVVAVTCAGTTLWSATSRWQAARLGTHSLMRSFAGEALATDSLRPLERTFLEKAFELSRQNLALARLALSQANSSDVRAFAQQMAGDYQQIGDSLDAMRRRKGAVDDTAGKDAKDIVSEAQQKLAQKSGVEFDRDFVRLVADQHSDTLALFEQAAANAKDADIRDLAGGLIPTLRDHYNRLVELRKTLE